MLETHLAPTERITDTLRFVKKGNLQFPCKNFVFIVIQ
jgi:hypothetical protein